MKHEDDNLDNTQESFLEAQEKSHDWLGNEKNERNIPLEIIFVIHISITQQVIMNPLKKIVVFTHQKTHAERLENPTKSPDSLKKNLMN